MVFTDTKKTLPQKRDAKIKSAPELTLRRLLVYLNYLKNIGADCVSSSQIAETFGFTAIQVRKDIACTGFNGRPKYGYNRARLISHLEEFLGFNNRMEAVLVGAGNVGRALASYGGFEKYSLEIVAICDKNKDLHGREIKGKKIYPTEQIIDLIKKRSIRLAIIAVPSEESQNVADTLIAAGVQGIWSFSSTRLVCPAGVIVQNEDLGASLSVLSQKLLAACAAQREK